MQTTLVDDMDGGRIESVSTDNVAAYEAYLKIRSIMKSLCSPQIIFMNWG